MDLIGDEEFKEEMNFSWKSLDSKYLLEFSDNSWYKIEIPKFYPKGMSHLGGLDIDEIQI